MSNDQSGPPPGWPAAAGEYGPGKTLPGEPPIFEDAPPGAFPPPGGPAPEQVTAQLESSRPDPWGSPGPPRFARTAASYAPPIFPDCGVRHSTHDRRAGRRRIGRRAAPSAVRCATAGGLCSSSGVRRASGRATSVRRAASGVCRAASGVRRAAACWGLSLGSDNRAARCGAAAAGAQLGAIGDAACPRRDRRVRIAWRDHDDLLRAPRSGRSVG